VLVVLGNTIISQLKIKYNNLNVRAINTAFGRHYAHIDIMKNLFTKKYTVSMTRGKKLGLTTAIKPLSRELTLPLHDYMNSPEVYIQKVFSLHTPKRACLFR
jgi:hypothetical protein